MAMPPEFLSEQMTQHKKFEKEIMSTLYDIIRTARKVVQGKSVSQGELDDFDDRGIMWYTGVSYVIGHLPKYFVPEEIVELAKDVGQLQVHVNNYRNFQPLEEHEKCPGGCTDNHTRENYLKQIVEILAKYSWMTDKEYGE